MKLEFLKSATQPHEFPNQKRKEVALVGRSNAGKSSLVNALANQKRLAYVSHVPGKTQLLNFFDVGRYYRLVDMPGYGYAKLSKNQVKSWQLIVEGYISQRPNLVGLILIMDIRRDWQQEEQMIAEWARFHQKSLVVVLNKMDKLSPTQQMKRVSEIEKSIPDTSIFRISALRKQGMTDVEEYIFQSWIK